MAKKELERKAEDKFVDYVKADNNLALKYELRKGDPDRLVLLHKGNHFFIEFKRVGYEPRKLQWIRIRELRSMGHAVYWTDCYEEAIEIYEYEKNIDAFFSAESNERERRVGNILARRG